jgi:hypothetical protein
MNKAMPSKSSSNITAGDEANGVSKQANGMAEHFLKNRCQTFLESFARYFGFSVVKQSPA